MHASKRKKILLFIDSLVGGGAQRQIVTLARCLHDSGYDVSVLTYRNEEQLRYLLDEKNIEHHVIEKKSKLDLLFIFRLYRYFKVIDPDCVISYLNTPNLWGRLAGRMAGLKKIITSERNLDIDKSRVRIVIEKLIFRLSSCIVVNANAIKSLLIEKGIPADKIQVIYNGLDLQYFKPVPLSEAEHFRASYGVLKADRLFLLPGRIMAQKNHLSLIRAVLTRVDVFKSAKLMFVGNEFDKKIKKDLVGLLAGTEIEGRVIFAGPQTKMPLVYSAADFVVLPSLWEGLPNVVIEAMACFKPVVVTDVADNAYIVRDSVDGFVVPAADDGKLADVLERCMAMEDKDISSMSQSARNRAEELFGTDKFLASYERLINS